MIEQYKNLNKKLARLLENHGLMLLLLMLVKKKEKKVKL